MATPDQEHPDCWLSDEDGWALSAHQSGNVVLENAETGEGPWHMKKVNQDKIIELWQLLQAGGLDAIREQPWINGYY